MMGRRQQMAYQTDQAAPQQARQSPRPDRKKGPQKPPTVPLGSLKRGRLFSILPPAENVVVFRVLSQLNGVADVQPTNTRHQTPFIMVASTRVYPVEEKVRREEWTEQ